MSPLLVVQKPWLASALSATRRLRKRVSRQGAPRPCRCVASARDRTFRSVGSGRDGGGMRAIDLACGAAIVLCACAPTDNGTGSGGPPRTHTLTLHSAGSGSGTVRSADPAFECSAGCLQNLAADANVRLTAVPAGGSTFAGWQ